MHKCMEHISNKSKKAHTHTYAKKFQSIAGFSDRDSCHVMAETNKNMSFKQYAW